jgi:hypothetical protein
VLGLCYEGHAQSSNNGLSLAPWKELPQFLKGSAGHSFERTKIANQVKLVFNTSKT